MKCGAKTRVGGSCAQPAMPNGRCRMHRGGAVSGLAHPSTKHGLYSKSMPLRLALDFEKALHDAELLSMREETAAVVSFINDALKRLDQSETGALWQQLRSLWRSLATSSPTEKIVTLDRIGALIERGAADADALAEVERHILTKTRVAESERKRLMDAHTVLTTDQVMLLVGALSAAVMEEVQDRDTLARIHERIDRALARAGGRGVPARVAS